MTPTEQHDRVERLSRLRAQVGNTIVDQLLRAHRFDGELPTPAGLLRAMEDVESWTPSLAAPVPFKQHDVDRVAPAQFFSDNCPAALTGLAEPILRAEAGAAAGDAACNALLDLAARAYPALLAQTEHNLSLSDETWAPFRLRGGWADVPPPSEYLAAVEALSADPRLGGLFEEGAKGLQTTFGNNQYALRLYDPTELLLYGAWRLALLRGAWHATSFRTAIVEQLDRVRAAAEGQPVDVPIFCGFSRARIEEEFDVANVVFRPYVGGLQNCLFDRGDRLDGSYHASGFVVERPHAWRYRSLQSADPGDETHDLGALDWTGARRWADHLAVAAAAAQMAEKLKPHNLQHAKSFAGIPELMWIQTADPLHGASSSHLSRDWTWHDDDAPALTRATVQYVRELESVTDDSFRVAIRRIRMALDQPRAWEDALVDAVIAWEALSGDCRDAVTLMTTGFLAKLISEQGHWHQIREALKTLYRHRGRVVHGGALDGADVRLWRDQAITAAVVALKQLCGDHRDLLGHLDRFQRFCLDGDGG